ncbi:MAG TPA: stage II sporulation protein M [Longimicrobium sp.]|nr:stage II sporulation protein M [Longimicrobium sp.]
MAQTAAPAAPLLDRGVEVETPEHVAIGYVLADLGSRFAALLIDFLILIGGGLLFGFGLPWLMDELGILPEALEGAWTAILVALGFLWTWGYFVYFEGLRDGQTPGKKRMGIRVVQDGGYPVDVRGAAIRNLLRLVDIQPGATCLFGGAVMMLHPQTKRLGDLAAGTVVVRERTDAPLPEEAAVAGDGAAVGPPRLAEAEWSALSQYVARREGLAPEVRAPLSMRILAHLDRHFADHPQRRVLAPDAFLVVAHREESARRAASGAVARGGSGQARTLFRRQKGTWEAYRDLLGRAQRDGLAKLPEHEVSRFGALYREVAADLARARTYGGSPELLYTLERAVGGGHNLLYRPEARTWAALKHWLVAGFPALVRKRWRPVALASALFYVPALISFGATVAEPAIARDFVGPEMMVRVEESVEKEARGEGYVEEEVPLMPLLASRLVSNNVQVTFLAFAAGILAGLGTVWVLVLNGVLLGTVSALFHNEGTLLHLYTFVLPHGVIELTAICIAGGAGLWMGSGMLLPGRQTRGQALVERAREGVSMIAGTAMLLVFAGLIEGFISPSDLPRPAKLALAAVFALILAAYLAFSGRDAAARAAVEEVAAR